MDSRKHQCRAGCQNKEIKMSQERCPELGPGRSQKLPSSPLGNRRKKEGVRECKLMQEELDAFLCDVHDFRALRETGQEDHTVTPATLWA